MESFRVTDDCHGLHSHHHVNHIIMSTTHHQVGGKCNSSGMCEFTGERLLGAKPCVFSCKEASVVAVVVSLFPQLRLRRQRLGGLSSGLKFSARAPLSRQGSILPRRALHRLGLGGPCNKLRSWLCLAFILVCDIFYSSNAFAKQI